MDFTNELLGNYAKTINKTRPEFGVEKLAEYLRETASTNKSTVKIQDLQLFPENKLPLSKFEFSPEFNKLKINYNYKSGDTSDPRNFRLICTPCKTIAFMEKTFYTYLSTRVTLNTDIQKFGKIRAAGAIVCDMLKNFEYVIFMDIANAYGSVDLNLMSQMINNKCLQKYFNDFYATARIGEIPWANGLIQGSPLSVLYFQIYLEYALREIAPLCTVVAYMDDIVIATNDALIFPRIREILATYNLTLNSKKTCYSGITNSENTETSKICGIPHVTPDFKYLGMPLFEKTLHATLMSEIHEIPTRDFIVKHRGALRMLHHHYTLEPDTLEIFAILQKKLKNYKNMLRDIAHF